MSRFRSRSPLFRRCDERSYCYSPIWDEHERTREQSPRLFFRGERSHLNRNEHQMIPPAHNHTSEVSSGTNRFQDHFDIRKYDVTPKISLGLCKDHCSSKGKCEQRSCESLHCCKFYLQGKCKWGDEKCKFGHDLNTHHNKSVLRQQRLHKLDPKQLGAILKLSNKAATIFPKICKYYNHEDGCSKGNHCPFLHICKFYPKGNCKYNEKCKRSHDLFNSQTKAILEKHGVNVKRSQKDVLEELRLVYKKDEGIESGEETPSDSGSPSNSGSDEENININNAGSVRGRNKEIREKSENESNISSEDESEESEIEEGEILD